MYSGNVLDGFSYALIQLFHRCILLYVPASLLPLSLSSLRNDK